MTRSYIKLGNIPENSPTQAHARDHSEHDRQRQSTSPGENSRG
jgi:hypothetical protein